MDDENPRRSLGSPTDYIFEAVALIALGMLIGFFFVPCACS